MDGVNISTNQSTLWSTECGYNKDMKFDYNSNRAENLKNLIKTARQQAEKFRDLFANVSHSYQSFADLNGTTSDKWLQNFKWVNNDVLPEDKKLNMPVNPDHLKRLIANNKVKVVLPGMYKTLQLVYGSMDMVTKNIDLQLSDHFNETVTYLRGCMCEFYELMASLDLNPDSITLNTDDIPKAESSETNKKTKALLIYRDTMNYLEYLEAVFEEMEKINSF